MSKPMYIFAGGGTGGHLYPALAVAASLRTLQGGCGIVFACSNRDIDRRVLADSGYPFVPQPVGPMPRGLRGWWKFAASLWQSRRLARDLIADLRPRAVLGLGGFAAGPVVAAAARAGVPVGLLSIDAIPGLANRHLAGRAEAIFAQFEPTVGRYGPHAPKVRVVGCPVRQELRGADPAAARAALGLRADRRTLLIMAGSLGAATINDAIVALVADIEPLAGAWQVLHVTGPGKGDEVRAAWSGAGDMHCVVLEFCRQMAQAYAAADLVLCRSGASTVGELAALGVPAAFVPYPFHKDQHQRHNAAASVARGAAIVIDDRIAPAANAASLRQSLLPLLGDPARLAAMRRAGAGGGGDAAGAIAAWLAQAGQKGAAGAAGAAERGPAEAG